MTISIELEAPIQGHSVDELKDWSSLWGDLLHVDMVLLAREGLPNDGPSLFARRALWEAAVVAYGRTAISGRRQQQVGELVRILGHDAEKCHEEGMAWRNQHAAHRVDLAREKVDVRAILDPEPLRVKRIGIRVSPVLGPEDEGGALAARFQTHVKGLRDLTFDQRIRPLERIVIEECAGDIESLLQDAKPAEAPAVKGLSIDISPSGQET